MSHQTEEHNDPNNSFVKKVLAKVKFQITTKKLAILELFTKSDYSSASQMNGPNLVLPYVSTIAFGWLCLTCVAFP
uniref:Uncharacterized protein n=1 Tax=Ditylenchus dipsaci TaxID=166011 RepID=A0A915ERQ4_9BILA